VKFDVAGGVDVAAVVVVLLLLLMLYFGM